MMTFDDTLKFGYTREQMDAMADKSEIADHAWRKDWGDNCQCAIIDGQMYVREKGMVDYYAYAGPLTDEEIKNQNVILCYPIPFERFIRLIKMAKSLKVSAK